MRYRFNWVCYYEIKRVHLSDVTQHATVSMKTKIETYTVMMLSVL